MKNYSTFAADATPIDEEKSVPKEESPFRTDLSRVQKRRRFILGYSLPLTFALMLFIVSRFIAPVEIIEAAAPLILDSEEQKQSHPQ